jgi:hypothetical protein
VVKGSFGNYLCRSALLLLALGCAPHPARSAPFCVEGGGGPAQCVYYDTRQCWQDADRQKGYCSANPAELSLSETDNSICMVDSARMPVCGYQNLENCQTEAKKRNAVCFQNTDAVTAGDPAAPKERLITKLR